MQFTGDYIERMNGIVDGHIAGVDEMNEQAGAFDVFEETNAEAGAFVRAFDQAREIGYNKGAAEFGAVAAGAAVGVDDPGFGFGGGGGIVGIFWTGGG